MNRIVFAGPSIHGIDLSNYRGIQLHPPAAAGDMLSAVDAGFDVIGLIDGLYKDQAAVWHKELLYALSKGVLVLGAASMGALRAAECDSFGMIGLGQVYQAYRTGMRTSDADVAVLHAPTEMGFRPLTIALVDAEATIESLRERIGDEQAAHLLQAARTLHFSRRSWRQIVTGAKLDRELIAVLSANPISVKRSDAELLLSTVRNNAFSRQRPTGWTFQRTIFFDALAARNGSSLKNSEGPHG
ncbi:TfuA-like protein [Neorhizobium sp. NCHU2750]|uniref:TfuA-like protein n=1 Tax=Neorhizobium sp. NCHU2750 TaxID=1825976 RepID=UPI000E759341|nr:antibiotic resistance protein [Neorhizobium sp. NCHU2750]